MTLDLRVVDLSPTLGVEITLKKRKNLFKKIFLTFIYFNRERQSVSGGGTERRRHTDFETGSRL